MRNVWDCYLYRLKHKLSLIIGVYRKDLMLYKNHAKWLMISKERFSLLYMTESLLWSLLWDPEQP